MTIFRHIASTFQFFFTQRELSNGISHVINISFGFLKSDGLHEPITMPRHSGPAPEFIESTLEGNCKVCGYFSGAATMILCL